MAGIQFAQRMPPQQGYPNQHQPQYAPPQHPGNNHAPMHHQQQMHPGMHPQANHYDPQMGGQPYYHDRMDGKQAGGEQLAQRKQAEIDALRFEIQALQQAEDPNAAAVKIADKMGQQQDPFNDDSEWNMKQGGGGGCCIIQ